MEDKNKKKSMPIMKELELLRNFKEESQHEKTKIKKMKIPRKAKVSRGKLKKGFIGVIKIDENGNVSGEKQKLEDSTIRLKDKTYHCVRGNEIGMWQGKHPVVVLPVWRKNPINMKRMDDEKNETHGQKYVMARMLGDTIKVKASGGAKGLLYVFIAAIIGYGLYMLLTGQF